MVALALMRPFRRLARHYGDRLQDRRERQLHLTAKGTALERRLSEAQRARMRQAYRAAGPQAVAGFRQVLEAMMDPETRAQYQSMKDLPE